jgi:hypothetical protein
MAFKPSWGAVNNLCAAVLGGIFTNFHGPMVLSRGNTFSDQAINSTVTLIIYAIGAWIALFLLRSILISPYLLWAMKQDKVLELNKVIEGLSQEAENFKQIIEVLKKPKEKPTEYTNFLWFLDKKIAEGENMYSKKNFSNKTLKNWHKKLSGGIELVLIHNIEEKRITDINNLLKVIDSKIDFLEFYDQNTHDEQAPTVFNQCLGCLKSIRELIHPNDIKKYEFSDLKEFE